MGLEVGGDVLVGKYVGKTDVGYLLGFVLGASLLGSYVVGICVGTSVGFLNIGFDVGCIVDVDFGDDIKSGMLVDGEFVGGYVGLNVVMTSSAGRSTSPVSLSTINTMGSEVVISGVDDGLAVVREVGLTDAGSDLDSIGASVTGADVTGESVGLLVTGACVGLNEGSSVGLHTSMYLQAESAS